MEAITPNKSTILRNEDSNDDESKIEDVTPLPPISKQTPTAKPQAKNIPDGPTLKTKVCYAKLSRDTPSPPPPKPNLLRATPINTLHTAPHTKPESITETQPFLSPNMA
jgi:hypothetical protein